MDDSLKQERTSIVEERADGTGRASHVARGMPAFVRRVVVEHSTAILCACLLAVTAFNLLSVAARKTITNDETVLIPSAYYHLVAGNFQLVHEHPPACKILAALPLLFIQPAETLPEQIPPNATPSERDWAYQELFWRNNSTLFESISFWTRVPMIGLTLLLGLLVFVFARELFGDRAALFALALFAFEPTVLAHGRVVQTDIAAAFGYLLVFYTLYFYARTPTWKHAARVGAAGGIALLGKFSMLLVGPILAVAFIAFFWKAMRRRDDAVSERKRIGAHACLAALALVVVVNAAYYFDSRPLTQEDARWMTTAFPSAGRAVWASVRVLSYVVPTDFVLGVFWQLWHSRQGHAASLLGMYSQTGWWYYFPVAFALKTTLPFLLLSVAALGWSLYRAVWKRERRFLVVLVPFALYTGFVMLSSINIGVRYYLPAYPFLFISAGVLLDYLSRLRRLRPAGLMLVVVMLGWVGVEAVRAYPNHMTYMSEPARRHPNWYYLSDSNVEWGDDVGDLARYLRVRGEGRVGAVLLGGFSTLKHYGVEYVDLLSVPAGELPPTRYAAVGASFLNGSTVPGREFGGVPLTEEQRVNFFDAYRRRTPEAVFGNSIYLYRVHE